VNWYLGATRLPRRLHDTVTGQDDTIGTHHDIARPPVLLQGGHQVRNLVRRVLAVVLGVRHQTVNRHGLNVHRRVPPVVYYPARLLLRALAKAQVRGPVWRSGAVFRAGAV
jgi:hypothetical protein